MQYSIGIAAEQNFRCIELTDAKIWISNNGSLCLVLANRVTFLKQARAWFLKIDPVWIVGMRVRVCVLVCVCVRARGY